MYKKKSPKDLPYGFGHKQKLLEKLAGRQGKGVTGAHLEGYVTATTASANIKLEKDYQNK